MKKIILAHLAIVIFLFGCSDKTIDQINYGTLKDGVYTNSYFNMKISSPKSWTWQNSEALEAQAKSGVDLIAGDDANLKATFDLARKKTLNLFSLFEYAIGSKVSYNPNISCAAEKVTHIPSIKTGSDYFYHMKKFLGSGRIKVDFPEESHTELLSGVTVDVMPATIRIGNLSVHQKYYAVKIKDYILLVVMNFTTKAEEKKLLGIMQKLVFNKV